MTENKYGWSYQRKDRNSSLSTRDVPETFRVCPLENGEPNLQDHLLLTLEEINLVGQGEELTEVYVSLGNNVVERVICFLDPIRFHQFAFNFSLGFADLDC